MEAPMAAHFVLYPMRSSKAKTVSSKVADTERNGTIVLGAHAHTSDVYSIKAFQPPDLPPQKPSLEATADRNVADNAILSNNCFMMLIFV
jgi:hypothetical protein